MIRERESIGVVPNHVIGFLDFFFERHLGIDHRFSRGALDAHFSHEVGKLDVRRTRHHDHAVAQGFTSGFIEKWNVCEEKFGSFAVLIRFNAPLLTNLRMENSFERAPFRGVLENYGAESGPIQVAVRRKNAVPKLGEQLLFNVFKIDKLVSGPVGIEKFGLR